MTAAYESLLEFTEERISRAEDDCGNWLSAKNRSRNTKIFVRNLGNQIHFSRRRGDPFRRELAITADGVEHLHFRPAKHDTIVFDLDEDELRINKVAGRTSTARQVAGEPLAVVVVANKEVAVTAAWASGEAQGCRDG